MWRQMTKPPWLKIIQCSLHIRMLHGKIVDKSSVRCCTKISIDTDIAGVYTSYNESYESYMIYVFLTYVIISSYECIIWQYYITCNYYINRSFKHDLKKHNLKTLPRKTLLWSFLFCFVIMTVWAMLMVEMVCPGKVEMRISRNQAT